MRLLMLAWALLCACGPDVSPSAVFLVECELADGGRGLCDVTTLAVVADGGVP